MICPDTDPAFNVITDPDPTLKLVTRPSKVISKFQVFIIRRQQDFQGIYSNLYEIFLKSNSYLHYFYYLL
jgi:hypothetical protein